MSYYNKGGGGGGGYYQSNRQQNQRYFQFSGTKRNRGWSWHGPNHHQQYNRKGWEDFSRDVTDDFPGSFVPLGYGNDRGSQSNWDTPADSNKSAKDKDPSKLQSHSSSAKSGHSSDHEKKTKKGEHQSDSKEKRYSLEKQKPMKKQGSPNSISSGTSSKGSTDSAKKKKLRRLRSPKTVLKQPNAAEDHEDQFFTEQAETSAENEQGSSPKLTTSDKVKSRPAGIENRAKKSCIRSPTKGSKQDGTKAPYSKDLINKLVNFPRTKKQQMILRHCLQEYARCRKKLSFPRFNLEMVSSKLDNVEIRDEDPEFTKLISEIEIANIPVEVLNNIADVLQESDDKGDSPTHFISNLYWDQDHEAENSKNGDPMIELGASGNENTAPNSSHSYFAQGSLEASSEPKLTVSAENPERVPSPWLPASFSENLPEQPTIRKSLEKPATPILSSGQFFSNSGHQRMSVSKADFLHANSEKPGLFVSTAKSKTNTELSVGGPLESVSLEISNEFATNSEQLFSSEQSYEVISRPDDLNTNVERPPSAKSSTSNPERTPSRKSPALDHLSKKRLSMASASSSPINVSKPTKQENHPFSVQMEEITIKEEPLDIEEVSSVNSHLPTGITTATIPPVHQNDMTEPSRSENALPSDTMPDFHINLQSLPTCNSQSPMPNLNSNPSSNPNLNSSLLSELITISKQEVLIQSELQMLDANITKLCKILEELREKRMKSHTEQVNLQGKRLELLYQLQGGVHGNVAEDVQQHLNKDFLSSGRNENESIGNAPSTPRGPQQTFMPSSSSSNVTSIIQGIVNSIQSQISNSLSQTNQPMGMPPSAFFASDAPGMSSGFDQFSPMDLNGQVSAGTANQDLDDSASKGKKKVKPRKRKAGSDVGKASKKVPKTSKATSSSQDDDMCMDSLGEEQEIILCTIMPGKATSMEPSSPSLAKSSFWNINKLQAHESAILDIKVFDGYLYTCSSDTTAKRFDVKNPDNVVVYEKHTKTVTCFQVLSIDSRTCIFTGSHDGYLRGFDAESGSCVVEVNLGGEIICMAYGWGYLFVGLYSGVVYTYNVAVKKLMDSFKCSSASIGRLCTVTEGALHLLCVASYDDTVTIRDATTGLLIRCLEGGIKSPCCICVQGSTLYVSTMQRTVGIYELMTGRLIKKLSCPSSVTSLRIEKEHLIASCFDGVVRCYSLRDWLVHNKYYGAGHSRLLCMDIVDNKLITANQQGMVDILDFQPLVVFRCEVLHCISRFGRHEDLEHHITKDHITALMKQKVCPWTSCKVTFPEEMKAEEIKRHIIHHAKAQVSSS